MAAIFASEGKAARSVALRNVAKSGLRVVIESYVGRCLMDALPRCKLLRPFGNLLDRRCVPSVGNLRGYCFGTLYRRRFLT
jgi:hypothetical protein